MLELLISILLLIVAIKTLGWILGLFVTTLVLFIVLPLITTLLVLIGPILKLLIFIVCIKLIYECLSKL